jgi:hypothetical protein
LQQTPALFLHWPVGHAATLRLLLRGSACWKLVPEIAEFVFGGNAPAAKAGKKNSYISVLFMVCTHNLLFSSKN